MDRWMDAPQVLHPRGPQTQVSVPALAFQVWWPWRGHLRALTHSFVCDCKRTGPIVGATYSGCVYVYLSGSFLSGNILPSIFQSWWGWSDSQEDSFSLFPFPALHSSAQTVKNLPTIQETQAWSLGQEDPLEKGMATHSSILAWKIPWTEEPGGLLWGGRELDTTERLTLPGEGGGQGMSPSAGS